MGVVPVRPQALDAARQALAETGLRLSEEDAQTFAQAFLAAEEIREDTQRIGWTWLGGKPEAFRRLCGPWRRADG